MLQNKPPSAGEWWSVSLRDATGEAVLVSGPVFGPTGEPEWLIVPVLAKEPTGSVPDEIAIPGHPKAVGATWAAQTIPQRLLRRKLAAVPIEFAGELWDRVISVAEGRASVDVPLNVANRRASSIRPWTAAALSIFSGSVTGGFHDSAALRRTIVVLYETGHMIAKPVSSDLLEVAGELGRRFGSLYTMRPTEPMRVAGRANADWGRSVFRAVIGMEGHSTIGEALTR